MSKILNKYKNILHAIGKMKYIKLKLPIDESVTTVSQKDRCFPFHLLDKVNNELKYLFDATIIEPVNDTSECVAPVVIVPNINSDEIRLRVDMNPS